MQKQARTCVWAVLVFLFGFAGSCLCAPTVASVSDLTIKGGKAGRFYAVVIGIDQYQDSNVPAGTTAAADAAQIRTLLDEKYGFDVTTLINGQATRSHVIDAISSVARKATDKDTVLIYFAGASLIQPEFGSGAWIPADGRQGDTLTLIDHMQIKNLIRRSGAHHVMIVSDSGFSPEQMGGSVSIRDADDEKLVAEFLLPSRWVLGSGVDAPESEKNSKSSYFSRNFISTLKNSSASFIDMGELANQIRRSMPRAAKAKVALQPLKDPGHKGGRFVFINQAQSPPKPVAAPSAPPAPVVQAPVETRPPVKKDATLDVSGNVAGAQIRINDRIIGTVPLNNYIIEPGSYRVIIGKQGYEDVERTIRIQDGKVHKLNADLEKIIPKTGKLTLTLSPAFAKIGFKNHPDLSYSSGMTLKTGTYSLTASAFGHAPETISVTIAPGESVEERIQLVPDQKFQNDIGMEFVWIKPGSFRMGSPADVPNRGSDETPHSVNLTKGFYIQTREATVSQWKAFVTATGYKTESETGDGPMVWLGYKWDQDDESSWASPGFDQTDTHPVTCVSYNDVQKFIVWLNGQQSFMRYRLPTEAEWEYAARAGADTPFGIGSCLSSGRANYDATSQWGDCPVGMARKATVSVGSFTTNAWGLYDMHGNVLEWCADWYGDYVTVDDNKDPAGPKSGAKRVARGGGWDSYVYQCRSANRFSFEPAMAYSNIGFRLAADFK